MAVTLTREAKGKMVQRYMDVRHDYWLQNRKFNRWTWERYWVWVNDFDTFLELGHGDRGVVCGAPLADDAAQVCQDHVAHERNRDAGLAGVD